MHLHFIILFFHFFTSPMSVYGFHGVHTIAVENHFHGWQKADALLGMHSFCIDAADDQASRQNHTAKGECASVWMCGCVCVFVWEDKL